MPAMPKPKLTEARLRHMQARASRVWRGESQPQAEMAEDILLLVGEVQDLRKKVAQADQHTLFPESESLFKDMDSLFERAKSVSRQEHPATDTGSVHTRFSKLRQWFGRK